MADLGQAVDDLRDLPAELALDILDAVRGVLDDVVDQAAGDGDAVELQVGEDLGDLDAVRDVGITVASRLPRVRLLAEAIGARQQLRVETLRERVVGEVPAGDDIGEDGGAQAGLQGSGGPGSARCTMDISSDASKGSSRLSASSCGTTWLRERAFRSRAVGGGSAAPPPSALHAADPPPPFLGSVRGHSGVCWRVPFSSRDLTLSPSPRPFLALSPRWLA